MTTDYYQTRTRSNGSSRTGAVSEGRQPAMQQSVSSSDLMVFARQHERIFRRTFQTFRDRRRTWDLSINRDPAGATVTITPKDGSPPVTIMSPLLRKALADNVAIITLNPAKVDAHSGDTRETARKAVESIRIATALSLGRQNEGKKLQIALAYPLVRYGVAALWKGWRMPPEPTRAELAEQEGKDPEAKRKAYFEKWHRENECFTWESVSPMQLAWFPVNSDPRIVIQDSVIPYESLMEIEDWEGRKFDLNNDGKVVYGQGVTSSEDWGWRDDTGMPDIHFLRRAHAEGDAWWVTEWVTSGAGRGGLTGNQIVEAKMVRRYRCPYRDGPYVIIPGGDEDTEQTDPHLRYWPGHMHPLIVYVDELNALVSLVVQWGMEWAKNPHYIRLAGVNQAVIPQLQDLLQPFGLSVTMEGAGADRVGVIKRVEVNDGEMPILPDVGQYPTVIEPALLERVKWLQDVGIPGALPNRWLTGSAFQEVTSGTGTLGLSQMQAAAVGYNQTVTNIAEGIERFLLKEHDAIAFWDANTRKGSEKVYAYRAYSDAPVSTRPPKDGDSVELTAEVLRTDYRLRVHVDNETAQDKAIREERAQKRYAGGWTTKAEALKEQGAEDPEHELERIREEQDFERQRMKFADVIDEQVSRLVLAMSGISMQPPQQMQQPGGGGGGATLERQSADTGPSFPQPATAPAPTGGVPADTGGGYA